jgi:O-antigen ligase
LLGYLLVNVVSTVLFAAEKARGLKLDLEILASALTFTVVIALLPSRGAIDRALRLLWVTTVAEAVIGLLCLIAYIGHLTSYGVQQGDFGLPMVYGTQYEANIFGSFLLGNFFLLLADYLRGRRSAFHAIGLVLVLAGVVASMTRTVWLGLLLGLLLFAACALRLRGQARILLPVMAAVPVLAIVGLVLGSATPFAGRLFDLVNLQSSSAFGRLVIFHAALSDWHHHVLLGSGTGSFNFGAAPGQPHPWLPSLFLLTLHDTGIIGLVILALLLFAFYRTMVAALRRGGELALVAAGAMSGFSALLLAFQTTTGFWFAYPWIVAGIGVAAARSGKEEST